MGIFGKTNPFQVLQYIGAAMQDAAVDSPGGHVEAINASRMAQAQQARQQEVLADLMARMGPQYEEASAPQVGLRSRTTPGMFGASAQTEVIAPAEDYTYQPPRRISDGLNINSPELPMLAMQAQAAGVDINTLLDVMKAQQSKMAFTPSNEMYDQNTGRLTGMVAPKTGDGQILRRDGAGGIARIDNAPGFTDALMRSEAAKTTGVEATKSAYDLIDIPDGNGGSIKMPRAAYLGMIGGGKAGAPGGMGYTPPAAVGAGQVAAATDRAKAEVERDFTRPKAESAMIAMDTKTKIVDDAINSILGTGMISGWTAGAGSMLSGVPGSKAKDLQAALETIKANIGFDELQTMRDNSPTGGALGQVAVQELEALRSTLASLDQAQSPEALTTALRKVQEIRNGAADRRRDAFNRTYGAGTPQGASAPTGPRMTGRNRSRILAVE